MAKRYFKLFLICYILAFLMACIYPVKRDCLLCVKTFFYPKTIISPNEIVSVNYKRAQDDGSFFTVSKSAPLFVIRIDNKYIKYLTINFKEPLQEDLKLGVFVEKEFGLPPAKLQNIEKISSKTYSVNINDRIQNMFVLLGKQIGDSFYLDNITYFGNSKYYFDKIVHNNYFSQLKLKTFWINLLKILGIFIVLISIFEIFYRYEIYIREKRKQK